MLIDLKFDMKKIDGYLIVALGMIFRDTMMGLCDSTGSKQHSNHALYKCHFVSL